MIAQKRLKELIKLMKENDLTELDLQDEKERVALKRAAPISAVSQVAMPIAPAAVVSSPMAENGTAVDGAKPSGLETINSPMVGTFYVSANPDAEPFVTSGDKVTADTVVCIVEAMKVFNEIKAELVGIIVRVLVENGQAVEFGQPLFEVKPT